MLYFQITEAECLAIQDAAAKLGMLAGLLELAGDKHLVSVTAEQMHAEIFSNFDALHGIVPAVFERGSLPPLLATPKPSPKPSPKPRRRSREHLAQGAAA